jgi:hypothetical protein
MTTTKSIEQLKQESAQAAEAVAIAENEARQKARAVQQALEAAKAAELNKKVQTRFRAVAEGIVDALKALGAEASIGEDGTHRSLSSVRCGAYVEITEERNGSGYWAKSNGRLRVTVGDYGDKTGFPQKADGTFNYAKIAQKVKDQLDVRAAKEAGRKRTEALASNGNALAEQLREELGVEEHGDVTIVGSEWLSYGQGRGGHEMVPSNGKVLLALGTVEVTPEQVRVMFAALRACDLIKSK